MNKIINGMYCSRRFAEWMICKNKRDLDYPAISYYKLVRMFCRTNFNEFFAEEERKGNDFVYDLILDEDKIKLKSSYEIVFLPYEGRVSGCSTDQTETDAPEPVDRFMLGYRVLQTRGCMPGSSKEVFRYDDYYSMKYLVDEILLRAKEIEKFADRRELSLDHILKIGVEVGADAAGGTGLGFNHISGRIKLDDVYRAREFQEAEERGFIDNEWPYSAGPECPDKIICRQMYTRIINHMMKEVDHQELVRSKDGELHELRVAAYVAALLSYAKDPNFSLSEGVSKDLVDEKADELFEEYCNSADDLDGICKKIRIGLLWDVNVVIDRSSRLYSDFDYEDIKEAPIGLTGDDYDKFERMSCCSDDDEKWVLEDDEEISDWDDVPYNLEDDEDN